MLQLQQSSTSENIIVTLNEKRLLSAPFYFFVFTNTATNSKVTIVKSYLDDLSNYQQRFNEFEINTSVAFEGQQHGQWQYEVFEGDTNVFTDGLNLLENGKMQLNKSDADVVGHQTQTIYTGHGG